MSILPGGAALALASLLLLSGCAGFPSGLTATDTDPVSRFGPRGGGWGGQQQQVWSRHCGSVSPFGDRLSVDQCA